MADDDCDGLVDEEVPGCGPECGDGSCAVGEHRKTCLDGPCIPSDAGDICSGHCIETCPAGYTCGPYEGAGPDILYICRPDP